MSEVPQEPEQSASQGSSTDYEALMKEAHPDLEMDPKRAEIMARASTVDEQMVADKRTEALDLAVDIHKGGYNEAGQQARKAADEARRARVAADQKAEEAGQIYDSVKDL